MTGGSPGAGPPTDAEVDAGWDALLGAPGPSDEATAPLVAAPLPLPIVPPAGVTQPSQQQDPTESKATAAASTELETEGRGDPSTPVESPAPDEHGVVQHHGGHGVERAIEASGRLGAAVVEDDELGAARSGRRVRVAARASQRDDEPAATSGSISVLDAGLDPDEPEILRPERPKVAVRQAPAMATRRAAGAGARVTEPTAEGASSWVGLLLIGAVIVGGLFFVQSRMRAGGESGEGSVRSERAVGRASSPAKDARGATPKTTPRKTSGARRDGADGSGAPDPRPTGAASGDRALVEAAAGEGDTGGAEVGETGTPTPPTPLIPPDGAAVVLPGATSTADADSTPPTPAGRDSDPRAVPEGTSPEAAAAFNKIPVSAGDGPPIGAIGLSGIHVDDIALGDEWASSRCAGETRSFSVAADKPVNVCLRIVHHRQEEQLAVAWQQDGRTVRRSKIKVPDLHAYRTRAFLALRKEYVGPWTVRITSADGAEVASASFEVVK